MRSVIGLAAVAILLASGPAFASHRHKHRAHMRPPYRSSEVIAPRAAPAMCQPLCSYDMSPCDPPVFKNADNRCGNPAAGVPSL